MSARTVSIDGLSDKDGAVSEPWTQLYQLMQSVIQQLQWKTGAVLHSEGSGLSLFSSCFFLIFTFTLHVEIPKSQHCE